MIKQNHQHKELSEIEQQKLYWRCRDDIKNLRRTAVMCFLDIGRLCATVEEQKLWRFESGINSFNAWIEDSDFGPGIGRRNVFSFMKLYRFAMFLLDKHNISIDALLDIGVTKSLYLLPFLEKAIAKDDKDEIVELLAKGKTLTHTDLQRVVENKLKLVAKGNFGWRKDDKNGEYLVIPLRDAVFVTENVYDQLDGKKVQVTVKEL